MTISIVELQQLLEAHRQAEAAIQAVKILNDLTRHVIAASGNLKSLQDAGRVDLWPEDFKAAIVRYWNDYKQLLSTLAADDEIQTIFNWNK